MLTNAREGNPVVEDAKEIHYENEPREMLRRVMLVVQILAESLAKQSKPIDQLKDVLPDVNSRDKQAVPQANDLDTKASRTRR